MMDIAGNPTSGTQNGYDLAFNSDGSVSLCSSIAGSQATIMASPAGLLTAGTKYGFKITRTPSGLFTLFLRGGNIGNDYAQMGVVGGSGTNPATEDTTLYSKYAGFFLGTGCKAVWSSVNSKYSFSKNLIVK